MKLFNDIKEVDVPVLSEGKLYIYVLKNEPQGNIKIGQSTNMQQRLRSLSGSNSGGNSIVNIAVSDATYLYSLETTAHTHFHRYRIDGTEWFDGKYITFEEVVEYIDSLFNKPEYTKCNELRKEYTLRKLEKEKLKNVDNDNE